jgi:membrane protease YdiL (CAAX protease family)
VALLAVALGWFMGHPPLKLIHWLPSALFWGALGTLPLVAMAATCIAFPVGPLRSLLEVVERLVVPLFATCNWVDLAIIAILAGLGEELLFRGLIQAVSAALIGGTVGRWLAWLGTSVLFGLAHWVTPTYAALAGLIGFYLGWLWLASGNLLLPITAHALYDFVVLAYLLKLRSGGE